MTVLLEREHVLADLSAHLDQAVEGRGRLVLLHGEAGVGKTSVLRAFTELVGSRAQLLQGWCDPLSTPRPLGAWLDVAPGLGVELRDEPEGLPATFRLVLEALAAGSARVLVFEDVHWADAATLDLVRLLARRITGRPVLLVASYRDDEIGSGHPLRVLLGDLAGTAVVNRLRVEPLSSAAVARLASGRGFNGDELYQVTGGNPFFVTEVLTSGGGRIPGSVADAVAGRLARVPRKARRLADVVAVLGSPAPMPLLAEVADAAEPIDDLVEGLVAAGVLHPVADGVGFRHELARMAVLDAMPTFDRTTWHARVLERLCVDPRHENDFALLAHHAEAAGDAAAVLRYGPAAAAAAATSGAHREAAAHYRRTLRLGDAMPPERRAEMLEQFAQASVHCGQIPDAVRAWYDVAKIQGELGNPLAEGDALRWLAFLLWPSGRSSEARRVGRKAVQILEALPPSRELAWAHASMCMQLVYDQDDLAAAAEHTGRATSLSEQLGDPEPGWQAQFHYAFGRYCGGSRDEAWAEMQRTVTATLDAGYVELGAFMTMLMSIFARMYLEYARADETYDALHALCRDRDLLGYRLDADMHHALGILRRGQWDDGVEQVSRLLDRPGVFPPARFIGLTALGVIRARRGDPEGWTLLDQALSTFEPTGWTLVVYAARAEVAWLEGDADRAVAEARRGLDACTEHTGPWVTGELARWVAIASGERPTVPTEEPFALELAGDWRGAAAAWEQLECPYDAALARLAGDTAALVSALETFEVLGARATAALTRDRLRTLGIRQGARGPRAATRANRHGLTNRQAEILRLVGEGLTDTQIAARLHLSAKTVNHHVTAAMTKLDVHTRIEAARKLADR